MREISIIKKRILQYIDFKGVSKYETYQKTGITNGVFSQSNGISEDNLLKFLNYYTDINPQWLLLGTGEMLLSEKTEVSPETATPENEENPYKLLYELQKENGELRGEIERLKNESVIGRNAIAG